MKLSQVSCGASSREEQSKLSVCGQVAEMGFDEDVCRRVLAKHSPQSIARAVDLIMQQIGSVLS